MKSMIMHRHMMSLLFMRNGRQDSVSISSLYEHIPSYMHRRCGEEIAEGDDQMEIAIPLTALVRI